MHVLFQLPRLLLLMILCYLVRNLAAGLREGEGAFDALGMEATACVLILNWQIDDPKTFN